MRTYQESLDYLYSLQRFGVKLGLDNIRSLLEHLGNPHQSLRFLHVAGTNGKGSVCAMLASIFRAAGYRTGLYTSPHLVSFCERIQIDGRQIAEEDVARLVRFLRPLSEQVGSETGSHPTFFEFVTALAAEHFYQQHADVVIWETGLGGRLDATNVVTPRVSIITNIALDHTETLGKTVEQIAAEKCGIIKKGVPVVTGVTHTNEFYEQKEREEKERRAAMPPHIYLPNAPAIVEEEPLRSKSPLTIIRKRCEELNAPLFEIEFGQGGSSTDSHLIWVEEETFATSPSGMLQASFDGLQRDYGQLEFSLTGQHQAINAAIAVATVERCLDEFIITPDHVRDGLRTTSWPARFQYLAATESRPPLLLDGAHNPDAAQTLAASLKQHFYGLPIHLILGVLRDKDCHGICQTLVPLASQIYCVRPKNPRAGDPADLARVCGPRATDARDFPTAWSVAAPTAKRANALVVVTGSLFLCGEALAYLQIPVFGKIDSAEFAQSAQ